jgi:hypothetical protein
MMTRFRENTRFSISARGGGVGVHMKERKKERKRERKERRKSRKRK